MLKPLLSKILKPGLSDIHLKSSEPPLIRRFGELERVGTTPLKPEEIDSLIQSVLNDKQREALRLYGDLDCAFSVEGVGRLRMNVYRQKGTFAVAIRIIPFEPKSFEELHLPKETMETLCRSNRGLVIVSGVTGAGKTTTLNAMINYMNENYTYNIVTIEDPIEYVHTSKKCSISQREVGKDVKSFSDGLRYVLRQDPDVIVLGEMRSIETFQAAIEGAASGHLVLATLHSSDTLDAIDRIVNSFDVQHQPYIRVQLTNALRAIFSQRLVSEKYGKDYFPATEVLFGTLQVKNLLIAGKTAEARAQVEQENPYGMHSFDQDLLRMVEEGLISPQEAFDNASKPNDVRIKLQGQTSGTIEIFK